MRSEGSLYAIGIVGSRRQTPLDKGALKSLADPTGGFVPVFHDDSDVPSAIDRVLDDLRDQYLIGFLPTHPADGKYHKLNVTVRGCDCHVRARAGFVHSQ